MFRHLYRLQRGNIFEMDEGGESGYEADLESNSDWEEADITYGQCVDTNTGHRKHFVYRIRNLAIGGSFQRADIFDTRCEVCPTSWRWEIELFRENDGSVSYNVDNERTDSGDKKVNGAIWVKLQDGTLTNDFFHREKYAKTDMLPEGEIIGFFGDAVTNEMMQNFQDNEFMLQITVVVKLCHQNRKRKHESDSSHSSPPNVD